MDKNNQPQTQITNYYSNCTFNTSNGVPVIIPVAENKNTQKPNENIEELNNEAYKAMIKKVAQDSNQPEAAVEYIIKLYNEYNLQ